MRLLHSHGLPEPDAWTVEGDAHGELFRMLPGLRADNIPGLNVCFVEFVKRTPSPEPLIPDQRTPAVTVPEFARFMIDCSTLDFNAIGSLKGDDTNQVDPLIELGFFRPEPPYVFGPFHSLAKRYVAQIDFKLQEELRGKHILSPIRTYLAQPARRA